MLIEHKGPIVVASLAIAAFFVGYNQNSVQASWEKLTGTTSESPTQAETQSPPTADTQTPTTTKREAPSFGPGSKGPASNPLLPNLNRGPVANAPIPAVPGALKRPSLNDTIGTVQSPPQSEDSGPSRNTYFDKLSQDLKQLNPGGGQAGVAPPPPPPPPAFSTVPPSPYRNPGAVVNPPSSLSGTANPIPNNAMQPQFDPHGAAPGFAPSNTEPDESLDEEEEDDTSIDEDTSDDEDTSFEDDTAVDGSDEDQGDDALDSIEVDDEEG